MSNCNDEISPFGRNDVVNSKLTGFINPAGLANSQFIFTFAQDYFYCIIQKSKINPELDSGKNKKLSWIYCKLSQEQNVCTTLSHWEK